MTLQAEPPATFPAAYARHLCRLCLCSREQTARQRLNRIEWYKWPGAEITRLYEQVVGDQLAVSEDLSELHCDACHAWLAGTLRRIAEFKRIGEMWSQHLGAGNSQLADDDTEVVEEVEEVEEEMVKDELLDTTATSEPPTQTFYVEFLIDAKPADGDHIEPAAATDDGCDEQLDFGDTEIVDDAEDEEHLIDDDPEMFEDDNGEDADIYEPITVGRAAEPTFGCDICDDGVATFADKAQLIRHFETVHGYRASRHTTVTSATAPPPFSCSFCPRTYQQARFLRQHVEQHHSAEAGRRSDRQHCRYCRNEFAATDGAAARRLHYVHCAVLAERRRRPRPGGRAPLRCLECTAGYLRPNTLRRHYEQQHAAADWSAVERLMCVRCFRQFGSETEARAHQDSVHERYRCTVCSKLCSCAESLERHVRSHSGKERRFQCGECAGTYVTANQLKIHHRRKHTDERPFGCPTDGCTKRYAERSELNVHVKSAHSAERYGCELCDGSFNSAKYLSQHVAKEHTGEYKFFVCRLCAGGERKFVNTRLLNAHMAVHHAEEAMDEASADEM